MTKAKAKPIRLTIPVSEEVHEVFQELADVSGVGVGRAMGEWLEDTLDGARFMVQGVTRARTAPKAVAREIYAHVQSSTAAMQTLMEQLEGKGGRSAAAGGAPLAGMPPKAARTPLPPRPVIRGGKSPGKTRRYGE